MRLLPKTPKISVLPAFQGASTIQNSPQRNARCLVYCRVLTVELDQPLIHGTDTQSPLLCSSVFPLRESCACREIVLNGSAQLHGWLPGRERHQRRVVGCEPHTAQPWGKIKIGGVLAHWASRVPTSASPSMSRDSSQMACIVSPMLPPPTVIPNTLRPRSLAVLISASSSSVSVA